jgi:deoxyribodipyrimidine photo-lyase
MVSTERITRLNRTLQTAGDYVLYWMQASARAACNHALEYAIEQANRLDRPLLAVFGLTNAYPEANLRHYRFLVEGLRDASASLARRGVQLVVRRGSPVEAAVELGAGASLIVVDQGYTRLLRAWRNTVATQVDCPLIQVESNVVVPVEAASPKEEYAAYTFRPKIRRNLPTYLRPLPPRALRYPSLSLDVASFDVTDIDRAVSQLHVDRAVTPGWFRGGATPADEALRGFIAGKLDAYPRLRNDPTKAHTSHLSPYLHFGQISPLHVALRIAGTESPGKAAYLEELLVRRELAINLVHYNPKYDSIACLPDWCRATLDAHRDDPREYVYTVRAFERAETHDPYWNAAQREMVVTGKMHGYMRMYWGKKILEWSASPEEAYATALYLNNKYELDGRDPNGYAGIAWCFGKHDRPWKERPIFGKIRYMNAPGLRRKFDADRYVRIVDALA